MNPLDWALLSPVSRELLRIFSGFRSRGQDIFPKQSWLASQIGCSRAQVNRCLGVLERKGYVRRSKRHSHFILYLLLVLSLTPQRTRPVTSRLGGPYNLKEVSKRTGIASLLNPKPNGVAWSPDFPEYSEAEVEAFLSERAV